MASMQRRRFIALVGGASLTLPTLAHAQKSHKVWRLGYLGFGSASSWTEEIDALKSGLRDLGYEEGKNLGIEYRWAERADQTFELAKQLVQLNVDVIFAPASTQVSLLAAQRIRSLSFLPSTRTLWASRILRVCLALVEISPGCRCSSLSCPLKSWRF